MDPPSPLKYPDRDGLPLSQLSPERVNGRVAKRDDAKLGGLPFSSPIRRKADTTFFTPTAPISPSLPELSVIRDHIRINTDVSGLVKRFEHLDVRDREAESLERRKRQEEALEHAKVAREEAEDDAKKSREELRAQKKELEECKGRERKAGRRVEILTDEMNLAKDQWSSQAAVYEKEVKRARKEAFKSSSAVLKLQEDSKHALNENSVLRQKLEHADRKVAKSEQDKFQAEYQLVSLQEELDKLRSNLRIAEEERERWKRSLQEEDVVRIASQGAIALPADETDLIERPQSMVIEELSLADIRAQMSLERRRRHAADSLVEFLTLECRYRCCRCTKEPQYSKMSHAHPVQRKTTPASPKHMHPTKTAEDAHLRSPPQDQPVESSLSHSRPPSPGNHAPATPGADSEDKSWQEIAQTTKIAMHFTPSTKQRPPQGDRETTSTPSLLQDTPSQHRDPAGKAYPFDREAALAAIAYRRGRAKSFAQSQATPRKITVDRSGDRRDISAPAVAG